MKRGRQSPPDPKNRIIPFPSICKGILQFFVMGRVHKEHKGLITNLMSNFEYPRLRAERHGGKFPTTDCGKRAQMCVYGGVVLGVALTPFTILFTYPFFWFGPLHIISSFIGTSFVVGKLLEYSTFGLPYRYPCRCSRCSDQ